MELWKFAEVEEDCVKMVLEGCPYSVYLAIHTQWGGASSTMYNSLRVIKAVTGLKIYQLLLKHSSKYTLHNLTGRFSISRC